MDFPFKNSPTLAKKWGPNNKKHSKPGDRKEKSKEEIAEEQEAGPTGEWAEDGGGIQDQNVKTSAAAQQQEDKPSYLRKIFTMAPATAIKAVSDMPGAALEKHIENKIIGANRLPSAPKVINPFARSLGRASSHAAGLATAPVFFSAMKDVQSKNPEERRKGIAKAMAVAALSGFGKGSIETAAEKGRVLRAGLNRALISLPSAGVALYTSKKTGDTKGSKKYLLGAGIGSVYGAAKGGVEAAANNWSHRMAQPKAFRRAVLGAMAGKGAEGLLAGTLMTGLIHYFTKKPKQVGAKG